MTYYDTLNYVRQMNADLNAKKKIEQRDEEIKRFEQEHKDEIMREKSALALIDFNIHAPTPQYDNTYQSRKVDFEKLKIDTKNTLDSVYRAVISLGCAVWDNKKTPKNKAARRITKSAFDSEFYRRYCEENSIARRRGRTKKAGNAGQK